MFKPGKIVEKFELDGKKVVFRYPKLGEAKEMKDYISQVLDECIFLSIQKKPTLEKEKKWLNDVIKRSKEKNLIHLVVEINGRISGSSEVRRDMMDAHKHCATFGISLLKKYTRKGLGTRLSKKIFELAKKEMKTELIRSSYYKGNNASEKLHKKLGFKIAGEIPRSGKRDNKYVTEILLYKVL